MNFWGKGALLSPKFNGCDTDSDSAYIGNNPIILKEVKKVQDAYLIPINDIPQRTKYYNYENIEMAKVDGQLCNDFIGKFATLREIYKVSTGTYITRGMKLIKMSICR